MTLTREEVVDWLDEQAARYATGVMPPGTIDSDQFPLDCHLNRDHTNH